MISKVEGEIKTGSLLSITGSGFGTRGKFHAAPDKMARMFDPFYGGLDKSAYGKWDIFNSQTNPIVYKTEGPRTPLPGDGYARRTNSGLGAMSIWASDQKEYYASFYMRQSPGWDITSASGGTHQFKIIRLYSRGTNTVNIYPGISLDGWGIATDNLKPEVARYQSLIPGLPLKALGWHKIAIYLRKSSMPGTKDGKLRLWYDHKLVFDWLTHFQDPRFNPSYALNKISGDFDSAGADFAGDWQIASYFSSASPETWADFDDIYLDHTLARVELGDAPKYADCKILEIQPPAAWSDGSIQAHVNPGALSPAVAYVYIIDASGNMNAEGFRVGAAPFIPTPIPSPLPPVIPSSPPPAVGASVSEQISNIEKTSSNLAAMIQNLKKLIGGIN